MDSLTTDGRCTTAVGCLELHWDCRGTCSAAHIRCMKMILHVWENSFEHTKRVEDASRTCFLLVNYLDLTSSCAFRLFLYVFRVFSWFLDKGKWFIHGWCVVYMGGQRAGGTGCWTPRRWGALLAVKHTCCWCWSLGSFTNASTQYPLTPGININQKMWKMWFLWQNLYFTKCIFSTELLRGTLEKPASPTFPPVSDLSRGCACVWLDTLLGLESGHLLYVCICLRFWDGADLNEQNYRIIVRCV